MEDKFLELSETISELNPDWIPEDELVIAPTLGFISKDELKRRFETPEDEETEFPEWVELLYENQKKFRDLEATIRDLNKRIENLENGNRGV